MRDLKDIERELQEIEHMTKHYSDQIQWLADKHKALKDELISRYVTVGYAARTQGGACKENLDNMEGRVIALEEKAGIRFSQKALEWWPMLKEIVRLTNEAAKTRDRAALDNIFIKAVNALDMKIERQEVKGAGVVTAAKLKIDLRLALRIYKVQLKDVMAKRRRLKDPIGKRGPLKKTTLKQYHSIVKKWPEKQAEFKAKIQKLNADIKVLKSAKMLEFSNGMTLTVHHGGQYPARMPKGPHAKETAP